MFAPSRLVASGFEELHSLLWTEGHIRDLTEDLGITPDPVEIFDKKILRAFYEHCVYVSRIAKLYDLECFRRPAMQTSLKGYHLNMHIWQFGDFHKSLNLLTHYGRASHLATYDGLIQDKVEGWCILPS